MLAQQNLCRTVLRINPNRERRNQLRKRSTCHHFHRDVFFPEDVTVGRRSSSWSASNAAKIIRFAVPDNFGQAARSRAKSGSVSATDITCSQLFSTTSVATIYATTSGILLFSQCFASVSETEGVPAVNEGVSPLVIVRFGRQTCRGLGSS